MKQSEKYHRMANNAEARANEAAASGAPWALRNLRIYQNLMSKFLGEALRLERLGE